MEPLPCPLVGECNGEVVNVGEGVELAYQEGNGREQPGTELDKATDETQH